MEEDNGGTSKCTYAFTIKYTGLYYWSSSTKPYKIMASLYWEAFESSGTSSIHMLLNTLNWLFSWWKKR